MIEEKPKAFGTAIIFFMICGSLVVGGFVGYAWGKFPISGLEFLIYSFGLPGTWIFILICIAGGAIPLGRVGILKDGSESS